MEEVSDPIMPSTDYQINWRNFQPWACESVRNLFEDQNFTDVTLVSDDLQEFKAHKVILSACSPFFEAVLKSSSNPQPLLFLKGIQFETLSLILRFVYEGEVNVPHEVVNEFMVTANEIKIKGLNVDSSIETNMKNEHNVEGKSDPLEENTMEKEIERKQPQKYETAENFVVESNDQEYQNMGIIPPVEYKLEVLEDLENPFLHQNLLVGNDEEGAFNEGRFFCGEKMCNKTFKNSKFLENHTKRIHIGEKNFKCPECPKMFFSQGEVESHKTYLHNNEKNFKCNMCEKTFVKMADANLHMKGVHLKLREHECRFCEKRFSQSSNMHAHMRRNHFEDWAKWKTSQMNTAPISD